MRVGGHVSSELVVSGQAFTRAARDVGVPEDVQAALWERLAGSSPSVPETGMGVRSVAWYGGAGV